MSVLGFAVTLWAATINSFALVCKSLRSCIYSILKILAALFKTGSFKSKPKSASWKGNGVP